MFKKVLIVLAVVIVGFLAFAATRPDTYHVERATKIDAPAAVIFAQLEDFKAWPSWSPWEKKDPDMKKTFEGPASGVGSSYSWQGNKEVGKGKMSVTASEPPRQIKYRLEFIEPFTAVAATGFTLASAGDKTSAVTWEMDGTNNLMGKVFGIFMNMDAAIGGDFEKGLASLKNVAETEAAKQAADTRAKAAAEVAAAAQVKANVAAAEAAAAAETAATAKGKGKKTAKGSGDH
jgi:Polyketide cyclase / dehydrase and lipid transport